MTDKGFWTTQDGRKMRIRDMDDRHLANTIRFLERQADDAWRSASAIDGHPFNSDDAEYEANRDAETLRNLSEQFRLKRGELMRERDRRKSPDAHSPESKEVA